MKNLKSVLFMFGLMLFVLSCASTGKMLYHKGTSYGFEQPEWVELAINNPTKLKALYPDKEVFITTSYGTDLVRLERSGQIIVDANTAMARVLATAVFQNIDNIYKEQGKKLNTSAVNIASISSMAEINGFIKESEWWIYSDSAEGERYIFTSLYLIDKNLLGRRLGTLTEDVVEEYIDDEAIRKDANNSIDDVVNRFQTIRDNEVNPLVDRPSGF